MATKKEDTKPTKGGYFRSTFYFDGNQYSATGKSQREADQKAALKRDRMKRGEVGITGNMKVERYIDEWMEIYKKPVIAEKQYQDYKSMFKKMVKPEIGKLRIVDVKDIHLQKILNNKAGLSADRLGKLRSRIQAVFRQAYASRLISRNPAEFLTLPKATDGTHRSITDFERKHFLAVAENHYAGLMFKVMLYCGLRTGEVVALDWQDIDFDKHRIKVSHAIESGTDKIKEPKTKAGIREVPIPNEIYDELLANKGDPFDPVFTRPEGLGRYTNMSRHRAWVSFKKQLDISMGAKFGKRKAKDGKMRMTKVLSVVAPDFVPYCLRHTYCTDLQDKGVPINVAKYLMGHANISVTASIYTHTSDIAIDQAAALINGDDNENNNVNKKAEGDNI